MGNLTEGAGDCASRYRRYLRVNDVCVMPEESRKEVMNSGVYLNRRGSNG